MVSRQEPSNAPCMHALTTRFPQIKVSFVVKEDGLEYATLSFTGNTTLRGLRLEWPPDSRLKIESELNKQRRSGTGSAKPSSRMAYEVRVANSKPRYVDQLRYWRGDRWVMVPSSPIPRVTAASLEPSRDSSIRRPSPTRLHRGPLVSGDASASGADFWAKVTVRRGVKPDNQQYIQAEYPQPMLEAIRKGQIINLEGIKAAMKPQIEDRFKKGSFQFPLWLHVNGNITHVSRFQFDPPSGRSVTPPSRAPQAVKLRKGKKFWVQVRLGVSPGRHEF